jgi:hypothetical protein
MTEQLVKRIFLTGPPGSMWSGCDRRLREAFIDIDNTDWTPERQWHRWDDTIPHRGAYFNVGNEFGDWVLNFHRYTREQILEVVDSVFVPQPDKKVLIRIHKSHEFSHHLDQIMEQFPEAAIITINNDPHRCLANWGLCDGFGHVYDKYPDHVFNNDYEHIWEEINYQHWAIKHWNRKHGLQTSQLTKEWIRTNFTDRLTEKYADPTENYWDGIKTLYFPQDKGHGLVAGINLSCIPWREPLNIVD